MIIGFRVPKHVGQIYTEAISDIHGELHRVTFLVVRETNAKEWIRFWKEMGHQEVVKEMLKSPSVIGPFVYEIQTD